MLLHSLTFLFFFFNDTATTEIYTLSLHDALPISSGGRLRGRQGRDRPGRHVRAAPSSDEADAGVREAVLLEPADQRAAVQPEPPCRLRLVPGDRVHHARDDPSLERFQLLGKSARGFQFDARLGRSDEVWVAAKRIHADLSGAAQRHHPGDSVLELPDVARPVCPTERFDECRGEADSLVAEAHAISAVGLRKANGELFTVFASW